MAMAATYYHENYKSAKPTLYMRIKNDAVKSVVQRIIPVAFTIILLFSCGDGRNVSTSRVKENASFNRLYEKLCTSPTLANADRDISLALDSGKIGHGQSKFLHAMVVYRQLANFDSVLFVCEKALEEPDARDDDMLQYCVYSLMTNSAMAAGSNADMLQYACKTEELAKKLGEKEKEQEMKATVGYGMVLMGHGKEGFKMVDEALTQLRRNSTWDSMNGYLIVSKQKIAALDRDGRYADIVNVCKVAVEILDQMEENPETVQEKPESWEKDKESFVLAVRLYRTQMLAYMAYASAKIGDIAEAEKYLAEFDKSELSGMIDCQRMIVSALGEMKHYKRMRKIIQTLDKDMAVDTLNESYGEELDFLAREAASRGDTKTSCGYLNRALALKDTLNKRQNMSQMARTISLYRVHEEQMKTQKAQFTAKFMFLIAVGLALVMVFGIVYIVHLITQRRRITQKNKALVSSIERSMEYKEKYERLLLGSKVSNESLDKKEDLCAIGELKSGNSSELHGASANEADDPNCEYRQLFELIDRTILDGKLYLDPDFQRQTLVDTLHIDRNRIGRAIRDYSGFSNLSAYTNSYRLDYAYRLLREKNSRHTIDYISKVSGFTTVRTFQRLFKERYGMTPAEFRESFSNM